MVVSGKMERASISPWPYDRGSELLVSGRNRCSYLRSEELGGRVDIRVVGGDMDEPVDIVFGNGLGDPLGSLDVDILVREVPEAGR